MTRQVPDPIRYLDRAGVERALDGVDVLAAVRGVLLAHRAGETVLPEEAYLAWTAPDGSPARSICLPASVPAGVGVKVINANPTNPDRDLDRASGLVILFDPRSAAPTAILAAPPISAARTAAVSALAVEVFAAGASSVAVIGCGVLGATHLRLLTRALPMCQRLVVHDRVPERAYALGAAWPDLATVAATAEEAARSAEVVLFTTTAQEQYAAWSWLRDARLVLNVSLADLRDDVFRHADQIVVDDLGTVLADDRRPLGRLLREPGTMLRAVPLADFLAGAVAAPEGVVVLNPFGLGICDVAVAAAVVRHAERSSDMHLLRR